jgi:hypothetical protein
LLNYDIALQTWASGTATKKPLTFIDQRLSVDLVVMSGLEPPTPGL